MARNMLTFLMVIQAVFLMVELPGYGLTLMDSLT